MLLPLQVGPAIARWHGVQFCRLDCKRFDGIKHDSPTSGDYPEVRSYKGN